MDLVFVSLVAFAVAILTFFSGFGLGTLLMPAFAIFFPVPVAIAATAVVHLANNLFKAALIGRHADLHVVLRFAIPAALAAFGGAILLEWLSGGEPLFSYTWGERQLDVTWLKLMIAGLIGTFAIAELSPQFEKLAFDPKYLSLGGLLSGFFGGLSGHQGALRSAFLVRAGLSKEAFLGTTVASAVIVDLARLLVYGLSYLGGSLGTSSDPGARIGPLVLAGTLSAFAGSYLGMRMIEKVTMRAIRILVAIALGLLALALGAGWV